MSDQAGQTTTGPGRWVKIVLGVSLALNLLVAGVVVGAQFGKDTGRDGPGPDRRAAFDPALGPFARVLPEDLQRAATHAVRDRAGGRAALQGELAASLEAALQVLRQTPFDAAALRDVMEAQNDIFARRAAAGREVVIEKIATMSDAERAAMADRLERGFKRALEENRRPPGPDRPGNGKPLSLPHDGQGDPR